MKRTIALALRRMADRIDPSRGWTIQIDNGFSAAGRSAADEFRRHQQAFTNSIDAGVKPTFQRTRGDDD